MKRLKIGYLHEYYAYRRNVIDAVNDVYYIKIANLFEYLALPYKLLNKIGLAKSETNLYYYLFSFKKKVALKVDLLHFWNTISYSDVPWVMTFETFVPRYPIVPDPKNKHVQAAIKALASSRCKKLIALSECTRNFQIELLKSFPEYHQEIEKKLCVIHPPQKLFIDDFSERRKQVKGDLSFIFVGREFFRKGGIEVLNAFCKLRSQYPLKLTIISSMKLNDYATRSNKMDQEAAMSIINKNKDWITYYPELPNNEVIDLMKKHSIGLLPTWADTYGYSVLEMQAAGCPVITTDIRALPEINNEQVGWMIHVPKNQLGEAYYRNDKERQELRRTIESGLMKIIADVCQQPEQIEYKAVRAIERIRTIHSPEAYSERLRKIYEESVMK